MNDAEQGILPASMGYEHSGTKWGGMHGVAIPSSCNMQHLQCMFALQELGHVPIIAEDLGVITADVHELRQSIGAPGMVVLQFAWGSGATNTHLPHNHYENSVCYPGDLLTQNLTLKKHSAALLHAFMRVTGLVSSDPVRQIPIRTLHMLDLRSNPNSSLSCLSLRCRIAAICHLPCAMQTYELSRGAEGTLLCAGTHDNETAVGWWKDSATKVDKDYLTKYLNTDGKDIAWDFIRSVYSTVSRTSVILIQVHSPHPHPVAHFLN